MAKSKASIPVPEAFVQLLLATHTHLGGNKITNSMKPYVFAQRKDGISIFDIELSWEKFILAARAIAGLDYPETICAISGKAFGRKPVLKFAEAIQCKPITSRFVPGTFTNSSVRGSIEPRLIVISDPVVDKQAVNEASMVNCPVIAFCNTDASLANVDIAIPVNNRSPKAIGAAFFILSRLVNYMKNGTSLDDQMKHAELFFFRDHLELEKLYEESQNVPAPLRVQADEADFGRREVEADSQEW